MKSSKILWIISLIPLLLSCVAVRFLPDKIPMHYDMAGNIDRWGSKYETFIFPALIIFFSFMWTVISAFYKRMATKTKEEKQQVEYENNAKFLNLAAISMALAFGVMHVIFTCSSYMEAINNASKSSINISSVVCVIWGIIFIILGNFMPKVKRNGIMGLRTEKTLSNDDIWRKSNRFAGVTLMIAGFAIAIQALFISGIAAVLVMLGIIILVTIVDLIYVARL